VDHHRLGDDEAADEEEDRRRGEGAEDEVGGRVVALRRRRGVDQHGQRQPQHGRDGDGDRLGHPEGHDEHEHRREPVLLGLEVERH
jgi:hypothetical protein